MEILGSIPSRGDFQFSKENVISSNFYNFLPSFNIFPSFFKCLDCGGAVTLSRNGTAVISYKEDGELVRNERCVWSFVPEDGESLTSITFKVLHHGFESHDFTAGFIFYTWTDRGIFDGEHM